MLHYRKLPTLGQSLRLPETKRAFTFMGASAVVVVALAANIGLSRFRIARDCLNVVKSIKEAGWGPYASDCL